jgi:uncharacterized repeat protein (TIGR01451 family)/fimbrial isopeptide formation D2 family protein
MWRSPAEQIRKGMNLLMIFSMLLSTLSPIYAPVSLTPSFASLDELRAFSMPVDLADAPGALLGGDAKHSKRNLGGVSGVDADHLTVNADKKEGMPSKMNATLPFESALTPNWLKTAVASAQTERQVLSLESLGSALTPAWLSFDARAQSPSFMKSSSPERLVPGRQGDLETVGVPELNGAATAFARAEKTALEVDSLGAFLSPSWMRAHSNPGGGMEGIVYSPPEEPLWAPLNSADGICTDPDFTLYHHTPISMTMGNATGLYTFTAVLTNTSATSAAGPLTFTLSLPANLTFVGNSASAINNNSALQVTQPANNMGGTIAFVVSHASPLQTLPPGGVVTFTYRLVGTPVGGPNPDLTVQVNGGGADPDCTVADAVNTNYCPLPGQLPLALTPPPHLVSVGNSAGDQYTVTLTNHGAYTLTDVSFFVSPSLGYFFIGNSAVMTHSVYGSLSVTQPASNTAEGAGFVVRVGDPYPANSLAPGETITLVIRLGTTANAKSGQPLIVAVRSGRMGAELQCTETRENIATGRGNLFLRKSVSPAVAAVGEAVTFTIRVDNTGLGDLYEPIITDTLGPGLLSAAPLTYSQPLLRPNQAFTYTITAEVAACVGVTNTALASWRIGNDNGQATANAPVSDTVNVRILNPQPQIAVQAQAPEVAYCQPAPYSVNVPVTITNSSAGAAAAFALNVAAIGGGPALDFSTATPGWVVNGGVISYTANNGLLRGNQTVTLTLTITYAAPVCNANAGALQLTPQYADACFPAIRLQGQPSTISLNSPNAPTLAVEKASSLDADLGQIVQPGDTVYFTVTVSGNTGVLSGSQLLITDVLPGFFPTGWVTVTTPGAVYSGGVVTYAPTIASEPTYAFTLTMEATYPQAQCTLGAVQNNVASATSPFCTTCLNGQDQAALVFADWDPLYPGSRMTAVNVLLDKCRTTAQQTVVISVNQPITWATAIFTDPLTANGVGPVEVVSGSVQVFVDGVDRTQDVTITTAPTLNIAFGNIGVYSATALITITYELTAPVTAMPGVGWYFVDFAVGGYEDGGCGGIRRAPVRLEVQRSTYQLVNVLPDTLNSCSVNQVLLNFDGAFYPGLNRELVAVFQTDVGDVITPSALTLSGSLAGQNVTVATGIVGGQQVVTFTLAPTAPLIGPGAISFPLYRACASTTPLSATLIAPDYCQVPVISNDTGGAVTLRPHVVLSLLGGGSVKERDQEWGFIVRNYGAVTATNVIVTNTLPVGFIYTGHAPTGVAVQTGTFGVRQTLTFTVPAIAPFSDVEVTITGTAQSCLAADQLWAGMTTSCGAVGPNPGADFCQGVQLAAVNYKEAEGILLTSNDQAAIIPLCGIGDVTLIVKNATLDNELYNFFLREVLTDTVYVPGSATISLINDGNVILPATPFTPTTIFPLTPTLPYTQVLIWDSQEMTGYPQSLIDALAARGGKDEIHITFQVRTYCTSPNPMVAADGSAANACGTRTFKSEDARSVLVSYPSVSASKTVRNLSEGGPAASRVFAAVGDQLVWNVTVNNISTVDVRALLVTDTLPGNVTPSWFNVTAVSPITTSQVGRILNWVVYSDTTPFTPALPALTTRSFLITGTVSPAVCSQPLVNEGAVSVGCSLNDVCPAEPYAAQAEIDINPNFSIAAADAILDQCAPGPLTLSITNNGARSDNVIVTYTLPVGFAYAGLAPSTNPVPAISPTVGVTGALVFSYTTFDQLSTATLAISVTNDLQSAGICRVAGSGSATLSYYDTCGVYYPNVASDGYNVTIRRSDISSLNIRPISQTVEAGQRYTWTITLTNTGDSPTNNLVVTATVGNGWAPASLIVSNGTSLNTSTPPVTATVGDSVVVTWAVGSLPINEPWTAQLSAIAVVNQTNYRIRAEASTVCNDGGCTSAFSDIAYNIPFQSFGKSMIGSAVSIAEPFTYTMTADFYGNVQYTDTALLDRLPQVLGTPLFSVTSIITTNINPANAWTWQNGAPQAITFTTSSVTRTVFGPDRLIITVTGFISNAGTAQQGLSFTNHMTLSTSHDGRRWVYTDAATGSIKEPILQIDKLVTPYDNVRIDSVLTYTLSIYHAWNSDATAYDVVITDIVPSVLSYVPGTLQVSSPAGSVVSATIGNSLIITVSEYPVSPSPILVTYLATVTLAAEPATYYPNNAYVRWTSQPGMNPYERTGNGLGPNDYWDGASATFATALLDQRKVVEANVLPTVGDAITYTVAVTVPVGTVRNLVITDNLPAGFVYSPSVSFITVTTAPPLNLPPYTVTTPNATQFVLRFNAPITNTTNGTAVISWTFRLLVDNSASIFHGASKTNIAVLSYSNGQNTTFAGSAWAPSISIYEPLLHIGKHYVTADACNAALFADNFNRASIGAGWVISGSGWTLANGFLRSGSGQRQVVIDNGGPYADFSFSSVFSSTDSAGDVGFIFRAQDAQNYYRFLWNRGGSGVGGVTNGFVIQRVVNDIPTTLASSAAGGYTTYRWHHVEIRSVGNAFTVYIDGAPVLSATDPLEQFSGGGVGFFTHLQTYTFFDNALVTRMGATGCPVALGDVVTYTLTVSNLERLVGHNLIITDILPSATELVTYTVGSSDGASSILSGPAAGATGVLTWAVDRLNPTTPFNPLNNSMLQITVTGRILGDVAAGDRLTNQALLSYDGQAGTGPFGIERSYSGGSHSAALRTPDAAIIKSSYPPTATIGQTLQYTITFPGVGGIAANLYTATLTDVLPVGFRMVGTPQVIITPANIPPGGVNVSNSTTQTAIIQFTQIPSYTQATVVITAVVENLPVNQGGLQYTNTATLGWRNGQGEPIEPVTSNPVTTTIVEPALIIEKSAYPTSLRPGDTVFYTLRIHHAPTSTAPAYNVLISDTLSSALSYISGSWEANNSPAALAATGLYTVDLPNLQAYFPTLDLSVTQNNPLILRYQGVVNLSVEPGALITNVARIQWTSLLTDAFGLGEIRDGSGGLNDYSEEDEALISLDQFTIVKTGPLTVTAGSWVTYVILVGNGSPFTGTNARVVDMISFRVQEVTGTFSTPVASGLCAAPTQTPNAGSEIVCNLGDMPPFSTGVVTITGRIDPEVPDGALVDDYATFYIIDSNSVMQSRSDEAETQVENETDLALTKSGPLTATAGDIITYTLVVTNYGPSTAQGVDAKDILPAGLTFIAGSTTRGACTSSICQIGDMQPGDVVTMVITASVGSDVRGVITNTAQVFSSTEDPNQANNRDTATTTVSAFTMIHVAKVDMTDPVYAGNTYFYQVTVTNTGPAQANNVVITDILPAHVIFEGASPGCTYANGRVTCSAGDLVPGEWFGVLINVRVPTTITDGTRVTNTATITTSTNVLAGSVLTATEPTLLRQAINNPTDLTISKRVTPASVTAGLSGGNRVTYTINITNTGVATTTAVQVTDFYPQNFTLLSATTSLPITRAQCSNGGVCVIDELGIGASAVITLVFSVPASVVTGTYTNTAHVSSASQDVNLANNTASVPVTVLNSVTLQIAKSAAPNPATPGGSLNYTIRITNTGPSDATNVTVSDTLPAGFTPDVILSSQGGCSAFPCNLGTLAPNAHAWVTINGRIAASVTSAGQISNTARVTSTQTPAAVTATVTPTIALVADVGVTKQAPANALPGQTIVYTLTVRNLGPSVATATRVTDTLPVSVTFTGATAGCTHASGVVGCDLGALSAGAVQTIRITATVAANVYPGTSLENTATITTTSSDPNLLNNDAVADTTVLAAANVTINKTQVTANPITAGGLVTYTITINNTGPGMARAVDVKDHLPSGMTLERIEASNGGVCGGTVCQFGDLLLNETRTMTVAARVASHVTAASLTNTAGVYSVDDATPGLASVTTNIATGADVAVTKVDLNDPVGPTEELLYQIVVVNNGPSDAQNVVVTDTLDSNVTFINASSGCAPSGGAVVCTTDALAANTSASYLLAVRVRDVATGTILTNSVVVTTTTSDPAPANNSAVVTTTVQQEFGPTADVGIVKSGSSSVAAGQNVTYTLTVTNAGPQAATNVRVLELAPAGTTVVSMIASNPDDVNEYCSLGGACYLGTVYSGATAVITVVLRVNSDYAGASLVNSAQVSADQRDPVQSNNYSSVTTTVSQSADLAVAKTSLMNPAHAGQEILYQIIVTNTGPSDARNVVITDTLPVGTTYSGSSVFCTESGGVVRCEVGDVAAGATKSALIQVRASSGLVNGATVTNVVRTSSATADPVGGNNAYTTTTTVNQPSGSVVDLTIAKNATASVIAGERVTYTLVITNNGPATATAVSVVDALPTGVSFVSATASNGATCNSGVSCLLGDLGVDETVSITIVGIVASDVISGATLVNRAQVASANPDSNPANNTASAATSVTVDDRLSIRKVGPATVQPEQAIAYQIVVSNTGSSDATNVVVSDTLPGGVENAIAAASRGACTRVGNLLTCTVARLAAGEQLFIVVNGYVSRSASGSLVNTASVTSAADPTGVSETVTTSVTAAADLMVVKRGAATARPGDALVYTLTVHNLGPSAAANVILTDALPAGVTFSGATDGCTESGGVVRCVVGSLSADATVVYTVAVTVDADVYPGASLENVAEVTTSTADPNPLNNRADADTAIIGAASFMIVKEQVEPTGAVTAGSLVTYTITFTNTGPGAARVVAVQDQLPVGLSLVSASAGLSGYCSGASCQFGSLPVGATRTMTVVAQVASHLTTDVVTNLASVHSVDAPEAATATVTTPITTAADLDVSKTALHNPVYAGGVAFYQIVVVNNGPSDAQGVIVTDTLPISTTYAGGDAACNAAGQVIACAIGTLPAGATRSLLIQANVDRLAAGGLTLINVVTATGQTPGAPVTATATVTVVQPTGGDADLALSKTGPATAVAGEPITYTLVVTNYGPADAIDVQVVDALPDGVRFVSAVASQGLCAAGVSCQLGELALDATATITVVGVVESDVISGVTLLNVARVDAANGDPVSGNNQDSVSTGVQAEALVRMTKEAFPAVTTPGASVTYRIVVTNSGPSAARNIVVTDMLPPEVTNATVSSSQGGCTGFPCSLGDLAPGDSATILVSGVVAQAVTSPFTNTASLATTTALASGSVTDAGATVVVTALADLLLVLESSPTVLAGGTGVVTATLSNLGPSAADGAVVTVTLPAGAGFLVANLPSGWYVASDVGGVVVLTTTNSLPAGASTLLPITVAIDSAIQPGASLQFNGQVAAQTSDPNPTNNSANADASVIGQADLNVTKVGPATAVAGALVTYTVLVANAGPTAAVLRDVKDVLPSGVTLLSATLARSDGSITACAAAICQTLAPLAVGEVATMTVVGRVDANVSAGAVLTNTATAFTDGVTPDPNPTNNTASVTTGVSTSAALRVEKVAFNNPVYAGDVIFYQIAVYNDGPSDAQNVVVTDVLPSSTTYLGGDVACAHAAGVVTCNLGALAANRSRSLQVLARVDAAAPHGLIVTNVVTAASPTAATPVTATASVTVQQPAFGAVDLAIEKNGPVTATAGTFITYTLVVTNRGPAVANAVQVMDALPYAVIGLAVNASQGVCNNSVVCQLGDLAVGASATVTITGWVRTETDHGVTVLNAASVSSNNIELTPEDNVDSSTTDVEASVLMNIEKTAQPTVVTPGGALSYRILVRNLGPSLARNVVMTDLLPLELESPLVSSARGYCNFNVCYLGDLPPGETVTILVMGNASPAASASFTNTALLTTTTPIHPASVIQAQARTDVGDNADLIMFKVAQATVSAGSPVTYVLTVRNAGPSTAVNVQVQDALPPDVVVADPGGCASVGPGSVLCPPTPLVSLTAGSEISWTIVVSTNSDLPVGTTLQNRATVSSDTPDPNLVNNTAIAETSIIGQSNLGVYKAASSPTVAAGNELTYTVVVTNAGPSDAVSVRLVDILPPEVQLLRPIEVERSLLPGVPVICLDTVCETGVVREAEILTFTLHVRVNPAVTHQTLFTNTATVYSPSDPDFSNNIARAAVLAERQSTLVITKQASPDPAITGALLTYQIKVRNQGPSTADGVLVGDLLPAGFTVTSVSSSQGGCSSLPCALGSLPPNGEATITIVGMVDPLQSAALVNTAAVTATTPLTNLELSQVTITTTVSALANLSLLLNSAPTAIAGLTTTVQAQVVNLGPSSAVETIVTLTLPAGAAYQGVALPPNWYVTPNADNTVTLTTTEILSPGVSVPLWVQVRFEPGVQPGSSLEFVGEISSQTPDNNLTDNFATTDVSVIAQADLIVYKTGPDALLAGALATYVITAENRGPSAASVRDLKDVLPAGVALQSATLEVAGGGLTACVDAICQVQRPLTVGEVITMTVVGLVDPSLPDGATLTNTATIFVENLTPDPNEGNNQAHHAAPVVTLAQIGLDKYDLTDPVEPDGLLVYAVVVTNTGPSLARNVVVTDALPPHVTYHSTTGPCSEATPGTVVCTVGDLAVGARMLFLIVVKVNATAPNGFLLRNTAMMTSATPLTHSTLFADETTRVLRSGGPQADLEVIKIADATSVSGGGEVTFTLRIINHGPSPVRNVQLLDLLPGGLTPVRVQTSQGFCNAGVTCLLGGLDFVADADGNPAIEGSAVVTIVARAAVDLVDGVVLTNTAYVQSELVDPAPNNNLDDASVTVSARFADVAVRKRGALYATAGEVITYTLTVENAGPATAQNVTLVDPMPQGVRYLAATPAPTAGSIDNPIWQLGSLAAGGSVVVELVVQVDPQAPPALIIFNTAHVSSTTPDLNLSNNQATATTQSYGAADLEVIKTADREIVYGDDVVHYTITVNNLGPSLSDRVDVKELLPAGVELLSLNASQGACVSAICQVGNIPVGEPVVITAAVRIISPTFPPGTVLTNTAVAFTNTPDPNPANNESSDSVTVGPVVNLAALKMTRVQTAVVGTAISYTVLVTNYGPSDAPVVIITDHLPYRFVYLSSNAVNGCVHTDEVTLVCNAGPLPAQRSLVVDIYFFISALSGERVRNRIVVDAPGSDLGGLGRPESELEIPANPVPTAILLETYTLEESEDAFILRWKTLSEFRVWGFRLWRGVTPDVNQATLLTPQGIPASGVGNIYTYIDRGVEPGVTYWYWLETLTVDGGGWMNQALIGRLGPDALLYLPLVTYGEPQPQVEAMPEETPTPDMPAPTSAGADASHAGAAEEGQNRFSVRLPLILIAGDAGQPLQLEPASSLQVETGGPPPPVTAVETPTPTAAPSPLAPGAPSPTPTPPDAGSATPEAPSSPRVTPTPVASAATEVQTPSPTPTPIDTPTPMETNRIPSEGAPTDTPTPVGSLAPEPALVDAPSFTPTPSATAMRAP